MRFLIFLFFTAAYGCPSSKNNGATLRIIEEYGYPSETHSVYTEDDYILTVYRIPSKEDRPTVLLQHGLFLSSYFWLALGPENALGFLLADEGYDVWLGNFRGDCYSREHKCLKDTQTEYWDFSYHEMGVYDVKATVDYVLNITKQPNLLYIGFSQGTTSAMIANIFHPDIRIKTFFFLAPVAYLQYSTTSLFRILSSTETVDNLRTYNFGHYEFCPRPENLNESLVAACQTQPQICSNIFSVCGNNPVQINKTIVPDILANICGVSSKQLLHFEQGCTYGDFTRFNYGIYNWDKYGRTTPQKYNLSQVTIPTYLYHSTSDACGAFEDIKRLENELGNLKESYLIPDPSFSHNCFLFSVKAKELLYKKLILDLGSISPSTPSRPPQLLIFPWT